MYTPKETNTHQPSRVSLLKSFLTKNIDVHSPNTILFTIQGLGYYATKFSTSTDPFFALFKVACWRTHCVIHKLILTIYRFPSRALLFYGDHFELLQISFESPVLHNENHYTYHVTSTFPTISKQIIDMPVDTHFQCFIKAKIKRSN